VDEFVNNLGSVWDDLFFRKIYQSAGYVGDYASGLPLPGNASPMDWLVTLFNRTDWLWGGMDIAEWFSSGDITVKFSPTIGVNPANFSCEGLAEWKTISQDKVDAMWVGSEKASVGLQCGLGLINSFFKYITGGVVDFELDI